MKTRSSDEFGVKNKIIFFDIETTGFNPFSHEIIEISAVDQDDNVFDSLIKPKKKIPKKITTITNISDEMVKDSDSIEIVLENFKNYILNDPTKNKIYMIGHNSLHFDWPFIKTKFHEHDIPFPNFLSRIF